MTDTWDPAQYGQFRAERDRPFFDLLDLVRPGTAGFKRYPIWGRR